MFNSNQFHFQVLYKFLSFCSFVPHKKHCQGRRKIFFVALGQFHTGCSDKYELHNECFIDKWKFKVARWYFSSHMDTYLGPFILLLYCLYRHIQNTFYSVVVKPTHHFLLSFISLSHTKSFPNHKWSIREGRYLCFQKVLHYSSLKGF